MTSNAPGLRERAFIGMQYWLPQHLLSRLIGALARIEVPFIKDLLIRGFLSLYDVDLGEAENPVATAYRSFNAFFTRGLKAGARPVDAAPEAIACPVDGTVSQLGPLDGDTLVQAKGMTYSATALLGGDEPLAREFTGGSFATIYLAPYNYHRIHMPLDGTLRAAYYVPGDLFSVNAITAASVPGLFARNERIVCVFDSARGPFAVVLVGALFVGSMSLAWAGDVTRYRLRRVTRLPDPAQPVVLRKGDELGRFNMGSTIVALWPRGMAELSSSLAAGSVVRMGERLARLTA